MAAHRECDRIAPVSRRARRRRAGKSGARRESSPRWRSTSPSPSSSSSPPASRARAPCWPRPATRRPTPPIRSSCSSACARPPARPIATTPSATGPRPTSGPSSWRCASSPSAPRSACGRAWRRSSIATTRRRSCGDPRWAYVVLGVSILLETYSLSVAMKEFRHIRAGRGVRRTLRETRDPTVLTVLFEDLAALFGLFVAFGGILLTRLHRQRRVGRRGVGRRRAGARRRRLRARPRHQEPAHRRERHRGRRGAHPRHRQRPPRRRRAGAPAHHAHGARGGHRRHQGALRSATSTCARSSCASTRSRPTLRAALPRLRRIYIEPGFDEEPARQSLEPAAGTVRGAAADGDARAAAPVRDRAHAGGRSRRHHGHRAGVASARPGRARCSSRSSTATGPTSTCCAERRPDARVLAFVNYWLVRDEVHVLNVAAHPSTRRQGHGVAPARARDRLRQPPQVPLRDAGGAPLQRRRHPALPQVRLPPRRRAPQLLRRGQRGRHRHAARAVERHRWLRRRQAASGLVGVGGRWTKPSGVGSMRVP